MSGEEGANIRGAEYPRGRCPGIVGTPYATANRAGLPSYPGPF